MKKYNVFPQKGDKWIAGPFDPEKLEHELNSYAEQGMKKNKNIGFCFLILFLTFCFVLAGCTNFTTNDDTGTKIDTTGGATKDEEEKAGITKDPKKEIEGTWISGNLILDFHNSTILFQNRPAGMGGYGSIVTNGNFQWVSYNGTTVKFLTYLDPPTEIEFTVTISEDKLTVSGLNSFCYDTLQGGYPRILDSQFWNGTYVKNDDATIDEENFDITKEQKKEIEGTWISGNSILDFHNSIILFKNRQITGFGGQSTIVTHGNFRWVSYDGTTVKFLTNLDPPDEIEFTGTISDNKLTVSGLRSFCYDILSGGYPRILDSQFWNGTYVKEE
jgi:hypothetical protein